MKIIKAAGKNFIDTEISRIMLTSLKIENFKNFKDVQELVFNDPNDSYAFSILVGKNGAGKSSTIDAIEWAVFDRSAKAMRASKNDDLICNGKDFTQIIAVFKKSGSTLTITKQHKRGGKTRAFGALSTQRSNFEGPEKVRSALLDFCGIDTLNLERILIKQQSASSVACSKPKGLLLFLEVVIGTDKIHDSYKASISKFSHVNLERKEILACREKIQREVEQIQPSISSALGIKNEEKSLNHCLFKLYTAELRLHRKQEKGLLKQLQMEKTHLNDVMVKIATLAATLEKLRIEIKFLNIDEKKKRHARDSSSLACLDSEGNIEQLVIERKRAVQKANLKAKKVRGLLISVRRLHLQF